MKVFSMIFVLLAMVSCQGSTKTVTADFLSSSISNALVTTLDCQAPSVVSSDVSAEVNSWFNIQKQTGKTQESIGSDLCTLGVSYVLPKVLGLTLDAIKPSWQCRLTKVSDLSKTISTSVCAAL